MREDKKEGRKEGRSVLKAPLPCNRHHAVGALLSTPCDWMDERNKGRKERWERKKERSEGKKVGR